MTNNLSRFSLSHACRKLIACYFCKHVTTTGRLPRGQWQMKSFIRSIHEPPFRQGCDQQSSTFSEQVLPAGTDRNIQTQFNVMEEHGLFTYKKPKKPKTCCCHHGHNDWSLWSSNATLTNRCSTDFTLFPQQWAAPVLLYKGFLFDEAVITSNLTSMRRNWVITRSA